MRRGGTTNRDAVSDTVDGKLRSAMSGGGMGALPREHVRVISTSSRRGRAQIPDCRR